MICLLLYSLALVTHSNAQHLEKSGHIADEITRHAEKGFGSGDSRALIKAIKLLVRHPQIRPLLRAEEEENDYYNPMVLIRYARKYTNKKRLLRKLNRLEKKVKEIPRKLIDEPGYLSIPGACKIFIPPGAHRVFKLKDEIIRNLLIRFQSGSKLGIVLCDLKGRELIQAPLTKKVIKEIKYQIKNGTAYQLKVFNHSTRALDCNLLIVY